jgi:hypothetical protein
VGQNQVRVLTIIAHPRRRSSSGQIAANACGSYGPRDLGGRADHKITAHRAAAWPSPASSGLQS